MTTASSAVPVGGPALSFHGIGRVFGTGSRAVPAVQRFDLDLSPGEFVSLVGPSGCGKSTLLSLAAGLDAPDEGTVEVAGGRPGLLFQEATLFPWLTIRANVEFPMRMRGPASGPAAAPRR